MRDIRPFVAGSWVDGVSQVPAEDKFTGTQTANVGVVDRELLSHATRSVANAQMRSRLTPHELWRLLVDTADLIQSRRDTFIDAIISDTGFPTSDAEREVERAQDTLILSGEEAKRLVGRVVPIRSAPGGPDRIGFTVRKPVGVVAAITPFNSPLNTVLHKVAPALAAGNGVVLKPSLYTCLTADLMLKALLDAGLPSNLISVVYGSGETVGQWLLEDEVPGFYAFTGSTAVGLQIRGTIGVRRAQLELGSLASTIVCRTANLERAAALCANAGFRKAGQVCTSVQRIYAHSSVVDEFIDLLKIQLGERPVGDPRDSRTSIGPVISEKDAERVDSWVHEAVNEGANLVYGGGRENRVVRPSVLTNVTSDMKVFNTEVFGPVASICPFVALDEAIADVNDTPYGLASGIFTDNIGEALAAADALRVGTVHINETSSARVDLMPFGGVKASGEGKEGPAYAVAEMTEERLITIGQS